LLQVIVYYYDILYIDSGDFMAKLLPCKITCIVAAAAAAAVWSVAVDLVWPRFVAARLIRRVVVVECRMLWNYIGIWITPSLYHLNSLILWCHPPPLNAGPSEYTGQRGTCISGREALKPLYFIIIIIIIIAPSPPLLGLCLAPTFSGSCELLQ